MKHHSFIQKYNRYTLSKEQLKQQEAEREKLELKEFWLESYKYSRSFFNSLLKQPSSDVWNLELLYPAERLLKLAEGDSTSPFSEYITPTVINWSQPIIHREFNLSSFHNDEPSRYDKISEEIRQIASLERSKLTGSQVLRLKKLLNELQNQLQNVVSKQRRRYSTMSFGRRAHRRRDHRQHIRRASYGTGRFMHVFSDEDKIDNTANVALQFISSKKENMFKVQPLLAALDSVIQSANGRLTARELELLIQIRQEIAENSNQQEVESHFILLVKFILVVKEYIDKML